MGVSSQEGSQHHRTGACFVNKVLSGHSRAHSLAHYPWCVFAPPWQSRARARGQRSPGLRSLDSFSAPSQKKLLPPTAAPRPSVSSLQMRRRQTNRTSGTPKLAPSTAASTPPRSNEKTAPDAALSTQKSHPPRERQRRHTHFADQETEAQEGHSPEVTPLESGGAGGWS